MGVKNPYDRKEADIINRVLPDCYLYISHLDLPEELKYWQLPGYPDEVTDSMKANFSESTALGRSAPVYTFSNAGPRTVQFNLEFHRDMIKSVKGELNEQETTVLIYALAKLTDYFKEKYGIEEE